MIFFPFFVRRSLFVAVNVCIYWRLFYAYVFKTSKFKITVEQNMLETAVYSLRHIDSIRWRPAVARSCYSYGFTIATDLCPLSGLGLADRVCFVGL